MTDQLPLPLARKRVPLRPFVCVDPEGKGRPWNGRGRRPDYVKKHLKETGMYPVAKPEAPVPQVTREELAEVYASMRELTDLLTTHIRKTNEALAAVERQIASVMDYRRAA